MSGELRKKTKDLLVIVGPTAIGKTELAIKVALHYKTEIISADSRQFYREMDIGTAKPSHSELSAVKHHYINSHSIGDNFSVGEFEKAGLALINELFAVHDTLILTGGSGLYIQAITEGFDDLPKASEKIRAELNALYAEQGISRLQQMLQELDTVYYSEVDLNNPQRLIRALEVCISTGTPFSAFRINKKDKRPFNIIKIGLNTGREKLYQRINKRVDLMIEAGLVDEVRSLIDSRMLNALNTVGYSEVFDYLDNNTSLDESIAKIKQNTRRFAKRQLTWFRKDPGIKWFEPGQYNDIIDFINEERAKND